ncbi:MAG: PilZ domain-containing protein [Spirochaetales bacterium]|nr:PilZ domain-containing protein [Spirochaetales bacterium]
MKQTDSIKERRYFFRVPLPKKVQYAEDAVADVKDISQGGICIMTERDFPAGTALVLDIGLPSGADVQAQGMIVRKKKLIDDRFEYGLKFFKISQTGDYPLRLYIEENRNRKHEKRRLKRYSIDVAVDYSIHGKAKTRNVNHEGICILTDEKIPSGSIFILTLTFPKNRKILTYGKVMWSRPLSYSTNAAGIQFWNITDKNKQLLKEIINDSRMITSSF